MSETQLGLAYARVSTEQQDEHSPQTQIRIIRDYIKQKQFRKLHEDLEDVEIVLDESVVLEKIGKTFLNEKGFFGEQGSAYNLVDEREEFEKMIRYARKKKIRHLFFYRANRFSRNDEDWGVTKRYLRKAGLTDVYIHSLDKPRMVFHMFNKSDTEKRSRFQKAIIEAENESYQKHVDGIEGVKTKFSKAEIFYKAPYGFKTWSLRSGKNKEHHVDTIEERKNDVIEIFELMKTGQYSLTKLARELPEKGIINRHRGKPFSRGGLHEMLKNVGYLGYIHRHGKPTKSVQFEGFIDEDTFYKVQDILKSRDQQSETRSGKKPTKYKSPFSSNKKFKCHYCSCGIVTDVKNKKLASGEHKQFVYLRCTNGHRAADYDFYRKRFGSDSKNGNCIQPYNTEEGIIRAIDEAVSKLKMNNEILAMLEDELSWELVKEKASVKEKLKNLEEEKAQLKARIDKLIDGWELGKISDERYEERVKIHEERQKEVDAQIKQLSENPTDIEEEIEISLELVDLIQNQWFTLEKATKAEILAILAEKVEFGNGGKDKVTIIWEKPWDMLYQINFGSKVERWYARTDSNCRPTDS